MDVYYAQKGGAYLLLNQNGKTVFSTTADFSKIGNGLYGSAALGGSFDNRGNLIIPNV